jgi:hypothetical protein
MRRPDGGLSPGETCLGLSEKARQTAITRNLGAGIMFVPQLSAKVDPLLYLEISLFA